MPNGIRVHVEFLVGTGLVVVFANRSNDFHVSCTSQTLCTVVVHVVGIDFVRMLVVGQHLVSALEQSTERRRFFHLNQLTLGNGVDEHRVHQIQLAQVAYSQPVLLNQVQIDVRFIHVTQGEVTNDFAVAMNTVYHQPLLVAGRADDHLGIDCFDNDVVRSRRYPFSYVSNAIRNAEQLECALQTEIVAEHNSKRNALTHHAKLSKLLRCLIKVQTCHFCNGAQRLLVARCGALVHGGVLVHRIERSARLTNRYHLLLSQLCNDRCGKRFFHVFSIEVKGNVTGAEAPQFTSNGSVVTR